MKERVISVRYYNVVFYIKLKSEQDENKFAYLQNRILETGNIRMDDIYGWCVAHQIEYCTKVHYRKDYPLSANLWNFYSYVRGKFDMYKKRKAVCGA